VTRHFREGQPIDIRIDDNLPCCPCCGQQGLLAATIPHGWNNPDGTVTRGTLPVVLCAACDHDSATAGPLIVYLLVHEQITAETLEECAALIQRWADGIAIVPVDMGQLDEEILAWRRGDL
jgi:hypothetical protein